MVKPTPTTGVLDDSDDVNDSDQPERRRRPSAQTGRRPAGGPQAARGRPADRAGNASGEHDRLRRSSLPHPRRPRLPEARGHVQRHQSAARRSRGLLDRDQRACRARRSLSVPRSPGSRHAASSSRLRSRWSSASASCRSARPGSCPAGPSARPTPWSTARPPSRSRKVRSPPATASSSSTTSSPRGHRRGRREAAPFGGRGAGGPRCCSNSPSSPVGTGSPRYR